MTGSFIVRAQVADAAIRKDFDRWYENEHLPDSLKAFGAKSAWRGWSDVEPSVHYAVYLFDDVAKARAIPGSAALKQLVAEFDRVWGDKIVRSRDIIAVAQRIGG